MFVLLILLSITGLISTDLIAPSLPAIANAFSITSNQAQLLISLFLIAFAISQLFYGPWSDKIGRKKPLLIGMSLFMLGTLVCLNTSSILVLYLGRLLQGFGAGAGLPLARVILRDLYNGKELSLKSTKIAVFISLAPAIAPFIGGSLQQIGSYLDNFYLTFFYSVITLLCLLFFFKETHLKPEKNLSFNIIISNYRSLFKNHIFILYAIIAGLGFSSVIIYANVLPFILQKDLTLSPFNSGLIILLIASGVSVGAKIGNILLKSTTSTILIYDAFKLFVTVAFLLLISTVFIKTTLMVLTSLLFILTLNIGIIFPNALAISFSSVYKNFGTAGAIYGFIQISISAFFSFILNIIHLQNQLLLGGLYLVIGLLGIFIYHFSKCETPLVEQKI